MDDFLSLEPATESHWKNGWNKKSLNWMAVGNKFIALSKLCAHFLLKSMSSVEWVTWIYPLDFSFFKHLTDEMCM